MDRSAGTEINDLDLEFFGADYHDIIAYAQANNITTQAGLYGPDADGDGIADNGAPIVDTEFNQMTAGGFGFLWPLNVGNSALQPERADTVTLGVVIDSPFEDTPWLDSWRFSIDYYTIEIKDAIGSQSADTVMYQCVDPLFNPGWSVDSPYCAGFNRDVRFGSLGQIEKSYFNSGRFETSGIDFNLNWSANVGPGRLNINTLINYLLDKSSAELPTDRLVDYTGTLGPSQNGLNGNSYEWRALTTVGYSYEDWRVSLRWSYRDSIEQSSVATSGFSTSSGYPAYHLFDLLMNYNVNNNVSLRFGIENLFDKAPPVGGVTYAQYAANGMTGGSYSAGNYDTNGRRFYLGMRVYLD
jgi:outer membrane receptor protein involved in Fe transport